MGIFGSTPEKQDTKQVVQRFFDVDIENEKEFLESLNISDLHIEQKKPSLPIVGGQNEPNLDNKVNYDIDFDLVGGNNNDVRFMARRRRYLRHNIFKILADLDGQKGGNGDGGEDEKYLSTSSDDEAIKNIKEIILKEVSKLNSASAQSGGGCGCDGNKSENEQDGGARRRKSKSKKQKGGDRRQKKQDVEKDDSSSSSDSTSSSSDDDEDSYNPKQKTTKRKNNKKLESSLKTEPSEESDENEESDESSEKSEESSESQRGGLSIFPFNSSEVKSSISEKKNMRMIRRKI